MLAFGGETCWRTRRAENQFQESRKVTYQVKLLLQLLVSVIDAELFKAVHIKGFKTEIWFKQVKTYLRGIHICLEISIF